MSEPFKFAFMFPDDRGMKRNPEMSREELLEVIEHLMKDAAHLREQHRHDLDMLGATSSAYVWPRVSIMEAFKRFWGIR